MNRIALIATVAAVLVAPATASAATPATASAATQYEGTVRSVNRDAHTFRLHDAQRGTIRIKVTPRTRFERLSGFGALHRGQRGIEATVRRSNGRWVAVSVERSGGGGRHGNDD